MPTYRCTASCFQCGTLSSPQDKNVLDEASILGAVDQAADAGYSLVVFTGGEATLEETLTLGGIRRARSLGLATRLVTNAWWADDLAKATSTLSVYQEAGLQEINFSTGDHHAKFVPVENVVFAVAAALDRDFLSVAVMIELAGERLIDEDTFTSHPLFLELVSSAQLRRLEIVESPWMSVHANRVLSYPPGTATTRDNLATRGGCDSVLSTTTVQADGRIGACCGLGMRIIPELQVGRIETTSLRDADRVAADDFLKRWIRVDGPEKILAWASTKDSSIEWEGQYAHRCQACLRIYKDPAVREVLRDHHLEQVANVVEREFVLQSDTHP